MEEVEDKEEVLVEEEQVEAGVKEAVWVLKEIVYAQNVAPKRHINLVCLVCK
jgi:hypothetical protein